MNKPIKVADLAEFDVACYLNSETSIAACQTHIPEAKSHRRPPPRLPRTHAGTLIRPRRLIQMNPNPPAPARHSQSSEIVAMA
jgi:hypothetical protein